MSDVTCQSWLAASPLPRNEARLLLQHVCRLTHSQVITRGGDTVPDSVQSALDTLQKRRLAGEPIAYLLGEKEFYGRMFRVTPDVLIPRPETEHLVEAALAVLPLDTRSRVWDMGCGSGILAVSLKLARPDAEVWGSDISTAALSVAQENAQRLRAAIQWMQGDWFDCVGRPESYSCDVIVSNPPYIERDDVHLSQGDLRFEPQGALTDFDDGLNALRTIISGAGGFLRPGGYLWLEHGYNQGKAVRDLLQAAGFSAVQTLQDYAGLERVSGGCKPA